MKLNAKELRSSEPNRSDLQRIERRPIYIICDNILDTYNVGSIFRLADAVAASKVYLCGKTETPPNGRIAKASVGTDKWVPWGYERTAVEAIADLRKHHSGAKRSGAIESDSRSYRSLRSLQDDKVERVKIIAIEQDKKSKDYRKVDFREPVAFIVGHETTGVSKEALKMADEIVEIPMHGVNRSLNVMVSLAIVLFRSIEEV